PGINAAGRGINARCILKNLAGQLLIDHMTELDVVISEDRSSRKKHGQGHYQNYDSGSRGPEPRGDSNPQSISPLWLKRASRRYPEPLTARRLRSKPQVS